MPNSTRFSSILKQSLSPDAVNRVGKETGLCQRKRKVTPSRLLTSLLTTMSGGRISAIADLLREFNHQNELSVHYKPFYNQLADSAFPVFMQNMVSMLMSELCSRTLEPRSNAALSRFKDIVAHDGSSFRVHDKLSRDSFGGLSWVDPQVRLHTTMSLLDDNVCRIVLTGNRIGEPGRMPEPKSLQNKLFLADRAHGKHEILRSLIQAGAHFVIRLSRSHNPWVVARFDAKGQPLPLARRIRLNTFVKQLNRKRCDVSVLMDDGDQAYQARIVVFPGSEGHGTRLCTNLDRDEFPAATVGDFYRLRWQIELLFKEWKSWNNLHRFDTRNPNIVEGLVWAGLAAAIVSRFVALAAAVIHQRQISTQRAARSAGVWLRDLFRSLRDHRRPFEEAFAAILAFLADNARRTNPARASKSGRSRSLTRLRDH